MKNSIKLVAVLTVAVSILCNCSRLEEEDSCDCSLLSYSYYLYLGFQDASGNDLVKDLEFLVWDGVNAVYNIGGEEDSRGIINTDLYSLDVVFPDKIAKSFEKNLLLYKSGLFLEFDTFSPYSLPFAEKVTYKLNYPQLFGDNFTHEIVSYWKLISTEDNFYTLCYRIELDGKEFTEIYTDQYKSIYRATLVLDR